MSDNLKVTAVSELQTYELEKEKVGLGGSTDLEMAFTKGRP